MKTKPPLSRDQMMLSVVLILLGALALWLWLNDPNRPPPGKSRVDWPSPKEVKP